ncbi:MAG TPA: GGDEF domain-containing protein [Anaerolineales bacterium]|nr:GGDEF domain-containing protein [Anaerolineales bacterium]
MTPVLKALVAIFQQEVRAFDLVARFGGDEFAIMLVDVENDQALAIAERIRSAVAATPIRFGSRMLHVQLSGGISCFDIKDPDLTSILKRADNALYHAKQQGRNCVRIA